MQNAAYLCRGLQSLRINPAQAYRHCQGEVTTHHRALLAHEYGHYELNQGQRLTKQIVLRSQATLMAQIDAAAREAKVQPAVWMRLALMRALAETGRNGFVLPGTTGRLGQPLACLNGKDQG